jgi:HEAT repeat protein
MPRLLLLFASLHLIAALGCRSSEAPATADRTAATELPGPGASAASGAPSAHATRSAGDNSARPQGDQPPSLRDLVGRLLHSEGDAGWQLDEQAAAELEAAQPTLADLQTLTSDSRVEVRRGAAYLLQARFNPADSDEIAAIQPLLDDDDRLVRAFGLAGLNQMRREDQVAAVARLAPILDPKREDRPENRAAIARLLGRLRQDAAEARTSLSASCSDDPDARVRAASLAALAQVAEPGHVVPQLARSLSDAEPSVRIVAAARLRQLGPAAAPAAKELAAALGDGEENIREAAAEALIRIGPPAVQPLAAALVAGNLDARKLALAVLARLGPAAKDALPAIEKAKQDADPVVRQLAETAALRVAPR